MKLDELKQFIEGSIELKPPEYYIVQRYEGIAVKSYSLANNSSIIQNYFFNEIDNYGKSENLFYDLLIKNECENQLNLLSDCYYKQLRYLNSYFVEFTIDSVSKHTTSNDEEFDRDDIKFWIKWYLNNFKALINGKFTRSFNHIVKHNQSEFILDIKFSVSKALKLDLREFLLLNADLITELINIMDSSSKIQSQYYSSHFKYYNRELTNAIEFLVSHINFSTVEKFLFQKRPQKKYYPIVKFVLINFHRDYINAEKKGYTIEPTTYINELETKESEVDILEMSKKRLLEYISDFILYLNQDIN